MSSVLPVVIGTNQNELEVPSRQRVPVLLISGTFGSGKTTVTNSILESGVLGTSNILMLENDIGKSNKDFARVNLPDNRKIPLTTGCVCCRSLGQLSAEVQRIEQLPEGAQPDLILIETSGIAHPDAIKAELERLMIPSILMVTVDVAHYKDNSALGLIDRGVAAADRIMFTWWNGITSPDQLDVPIIRDVLKDIERIELEAIALSVKREQAPHIFYRPAQGVTPSEFIAQAPAMKLLPSAEWTPSDFVARPYESDHARLKADTYRFRAGVTGRDLLNALEPFVANGGRIIRFKSDNIDIVQNEISDSHHDATIEGSANLVTSPPIDPSLLADILDTDVENSREESAEVRSLAAASRRLRELTARHPTNPVYAEGIQIDFDEDEGLDYADRKGMDKSLRDAFYDRSLAPRIAALEAIQSGAFDNHPELPYYKWRLGSQMVWWIEAKADDLIRNGVYELFCDARPAHLYFEGFLTITEPGQVKELEVSSLRWIRTMTKALIEESGDRNGALSIARAAFERSREIDPTGLWAKHWNGIEEILAEL
jgi:G3E family GTPase